MRNLIVYYSLEGTTKYVAEKIAEKLEADILELIPKKSYHSKGILKFIFGGKSAIMAEKPALEDYNIDLSLYDRIILGSPVWASNFTPPIRSFILDNKSQLNNKKFACYLCQAGAGGEKALKKLADCLDIEKFDLSYIFTALYKDPEKDKKIDSFYYMLRV